MIIWSLTTDDDYGIDTALYLTERAAYEALALHWFTHETDGKRQEHPDVQRKADYLAALDKGEDEAERWLGNYIIDEGEHRSLRYRVTKHDHPWTFPDTSSDPMYHALSDAAMTPMHHAALADVHDYIRRHGDDNTPPEWLTQLFSQSHVVAALDAFWASIAESRPYIKTGDLDPAEAQAFTQAATKAVAAWIAANAEDDDDDA
jgi:hypothetical protein